MALGASQNNRPNSSRSSNSTNSTQSGSQPTQATNLVGKSALLDASGKFKGSQASNDQKNYNTMNNTADSEDGVGHIMGNGGQSDYQ